MHILLGIISLLSIIGFTLIRANTIAITLRELGFSLGGLGTIIRRRFTHKNALKHPLSQINDPREATLALMVSVMKDNGELTAEQINELEFWADQRLNFVDPAEMVSLARFHVKDHVESGAVLQRVGKNLAMKCNGEQRADIIDLVESAAIGRRKLAEVSTSAERYNHMSSLQAHTIKQLKYRLGDTSQKTHNNDNNETSHRNARHG